MGTAEQEHRSDILKLKEIVSFKGVLKVLESGLRIGGSKEVVGVGECDNPIIKHPITNIPYIPGSSIKGKLRSLLELHNKQYTQKGEPCDCGECKICKIFGCGKTAKLKEPTRIILRDAHPTKSTLEWWKNANEDIITTELKSEVQIDRKTGKAGGGGPRQTERVPAGSEFDFAFSLRIFEGDDVAKFYETLAEGFELLSKDYLGGCGSRGYGHVEIVAEDGTPMYTYLRNKAQEARKAAG